MDIQTDLLLQFFEKMLLIRRFEETTYDLSKRGIVPGSVHLCSGEEGPAVGACAPLGQADCILPTHRGHGQVLAKGAEPKYVLAEIIGRKTGICQGRVGSMHLFDKELNIMGSNGIVGAQFPLSVGLGLGLKLQELDNCLVCFFGDGASNQGVFYEALNLATLWNLPIIYVCVNNLYGMGTRYENTSNAQVHEKAKALKVHAETVDGNDIEAVYAKMTELVGMAKTEKKPALLECYTYRYMGHSAFDQRPYRSKEEIEKWKKLDPITRLETRLLEQNVDAATLDGIRKHVDEVMEEAEKFAVESECSTFEAAMEQ